MDYPAEAFPEGTLERQIIENIAAYVGRKAEEALADVYKTARIRVSVMINYNLDAYSIVSLAKEIRESSDYFTREGYVLQQ